MQKKYSMNIKITAPLKVAKNNSKSNSTICNWQRIEYYLMKHLKPTYPTEGVDHTVHT